MVACTPQRQHMIMKAGAGRQAENHRPEESDSSWYRPWVNAILWKEALTSTHPYYLPQPSDHVPATLWIRLAPLRSELCCVSRTVDGQTSGSHASASHSSVVAARKPTSPLMTSAMGKCRSVVVSGLTVLRPPITYRGP